MEKDGHGDSTHAEKWIGLLMAEETKTCIDKVRIVQQDGKDNGNKPQLSRNEICGASVSAH